MENVLQSAHYALMKCQDAFTLHELYQIAMTNDVIRQRQPIIQNGTDKHDNTIC
jgi:hypothetical protein